MKEFKYLGLVLQKYGKIHGIVWILQDRKETVGIMEGRTVGMALKKTSLQYGSFEQTHVSEVRMECLRFRIQANERELFGGSLWCQWDGWQK